jgi:bifunctional NMN adenylyltransferase/nudix hydrolase
MQVKEEYDVGVIIGRFQVPALHDAHKQLFRSVIDKHDKVLVFLGLSPAGVTKENPLDFESRKQMILKEFPDLNVLYIKDTSSDETWSRRLDEMIADITTPAQSTVLYGGRDSFIAHYTGKNGTRELTQDVWVSGSEIRKDIARKSVKSDPAFRAGVIWATQSRYPVAFPTVDVGIFADDRHEKLLLGRKPTETLYRVIGGFAEPESECFEDDARREAFEETGLHISWPKYIGSYKIDDWRYRSEQDKIKTTLFAANSLGGQPTPGDDIVEVRWFAISELTLSLVVPQHHRLVKALVPNGPVWQDHTIL